MQVSDFRCLRSAELEFDPRFTLICGPNASGKTSVLEALYILGRGRSFRTRRIENLVARGQDRFVVFGEFDLPVRRVSMGVEGSAGGLRARINGTQPPTLAALASSFPVQIIDPEVHRLIEEGPGRRRRFLDWGVFHVEPQFVDQWQRCQLVLKQRNAALKRHQNAAAVAAWDAEFIQCGEFVSEARRRYVETLEPVAHAIVQRLLGLSLSLSLRTGWAQDKSLADALGASRIQERESGVTLVGPQRAELAIRLDGLAVKDRISRGHQKLLSAALLLAQLRLFPVHGTVVPTLLLDDPAAELDADHLQELIGEVRADVLQLVVTTLLPGFNWLGEPGRRYGVREGVVTAD